MSDPRVVAKLGSRARMRLSTDERLVTLVRRGDAAAFEAAYERHVGELLAFCVYMLGSRHDAEDAVQATFISAYKALRARTRGRSHSARGCSRSLVMSASAPCQRRPTAELNGEPAWAPTRSARCSFARRCARCS